MNDIKSVIREEYGKIATSAGEGPGCCAPSCCGPEAAPTPQDLISGKLGYSEEEISSAPEGSNLGLGCGNPQAIAGLEPGETVLDLGSGGGFDCFLAAEQVGRRGAVIGVDMTPEMITRARENAEEAGTDNVDFRLGEIEHLPVADESVDVIISNCVINLSNEKDAVFREAYRVLRSGGRLAISDVVARAELPEEVRNDPALHVGCVAGAEEIDKLERLLADVGFQAISIRSKDDSREIIQEWSEGAGLENWVTSATIEATKP